MINERTFNGEVMIEFKVFFESALIHRIVISKDRITIGRSEDNDVVLANRHVSRLEAIIEIEGDQIRLIDKSRNGILMDSRRVSESVALPSRCRLDIYPFEIECLHLKEDETMPIPIPEKPKPTSETEQGRKTPFAKHSVISSHFTGLIGESPGMQQLYRLIQDVGDSPATILVRGEHGTGKELIARALHNVSQRKGKIFVPVNCAAIPVDLIESELFGYEKGAFTGAQTAKSGKIEEAAGGTLFLDEIGELSMAAQAKLLRFLQEKTVMRLGSAREVPIDVRVIAATNRDLEKDINEGNFRADLYHRLRVVQIPVPPLRERLEDVPLLVKHFLMKIANELGLTAEPIVTDEAMHRLKTAQWGGNVRQLENALYSATLRSRPSHVIDEAVLLEDAPMWMASEGGEQESPLEALSKQAFIQILTEHQWDTTKVAKVLRVSRGTIYYKMKKYGIEAPRSSPRGHL